MTPSALLDAALRYAELGYRVFPCASGTKSPLTEHGFHDASVDKEQIEAWWARWPDANVAIATQGLLVLDIDGRVNNWLASDPEKLADLACASVSLTPGGGRHYVYRQPAGRSWRCTTSKLAPRVDTRADGGYIVAPPSIVDGKAYRWAPGLELDESQGGLTEPPGWLVEAINQLAAKSSTSSVTSGSTETNKIQQGQRDTTLARLAGTMRRVGMTQEEILAALRRTNADRCVPPLGIADVERIARSIARYEPDQIAVAMSEGHWEQMLRTSGPELAPVGLGKLVTGYPELRQPVIHGLLRRGETMNIIAPSKLGKSWLVTDLGLAVATGRPWLGIFATERGDVLLIDNELHPETSANRIPKVATARGISIDEVSEHVFVQNLRGQLLDIFLLGSYFRALEPGRFKVIILDAFYRFMPREMDENDNGTMANLYNHLDSYADLLGCSFVLIHHTSKGNQSGKALTDVGAGAGSQSRATDTHLILRPHEQDDVVVLEAAVRSWAPVMGRCLRWTFPVWSPADELDPSLLRNEQPRRTRQQVREPEWDAARFTSTLVHADPKLVDAILVEANKLGVNDFKCRTLLRKAEAIGLVHRWDMGRGRLGYATQVPPVHVEEDLPPTSKRLRVDAMLRQSPELSSAEVADLCGVSDRYVRKLRSLLPVASPEKQAGTTPGTRPGTESK